ncbi:MAG: hypothetical protein LBK28_04445, partial [Propionibacteriaceae bacterium]|nr:hypothetical protein [Propionibacteriaceae bacterium]
PWFSSFLLSIQALDFEYSIKTIPLLVGVISIVVGMISLITTVMICGVADGVGRGLRPSYGELFQRGLRAIPRAILPMLLFGVGGALLCALFSAWLKTMVDQLIDGNTSGLNQTALLGALVMLFIELILAVLLLVLQVRLFLFAPILYLEKASGFAALSRSWKLSKGASGRILLMILIFTMSVGMIGQICAIPASFSLSDPPYVGTSSFPDYLITYLSQGLGWLIFYALASLILSVLASVLLSISSVIFYHDQLRMKGEATPSVQS